MKAINNANTHTHLHPRPRTRGAGRGDGCGLRAELGRRSGVLHAFPRDQHTNDPRGSAHSPLPRSPGHHSPERAAALRAVSRSPRGGSGVTAAPRGRTGPGDAPLRRPRVRILRPGRAVSGETRPLRSSCRARAASHGSGGPVQNVTLLLPAVTSQALPFLPCEIYLRRSYLNGSGNSSSLIHGLKMLSRFER